MADSNVLHSELRSRAIGIPLLDANVPRLTDFVDFVLTPSSINQNEVISEKESIFRKTVEGFWHGGDRSSSVCFGFDNSRNPKRNRAPQTWECFHGGNVIVDRNDIIQCWSAPRNSWTTLESGTTIPG